VQLIHYKVDSNAGEEFTVRVKELLNELSSLDVDHILRAQCSAYPMAPSARTSR
jgi:hypothetical protein